MAGCDPTKVLRDEHRLILRVVDALEVRLDAGAGAPELGEYLTFFRLFTDACHHGKEEDLLFEAMAGHGFSKGEGPLAALLEEHRDGRALVRRMAAATEAVQRGEVGAEADFAAAGREYAALLHRHIEKEDGGIFDVADGALPEPACRALCEAYDATCARRFEGSTGAQLEALGERLVEEARSS